MFLRGGRDIWNTTTDDLDKTEAWRLATGRRLKYYPVSFIAFDRFLDNLVYMDFLLSLFRKPFFIWQDNMHPFLQTPRPSMMSLSAGYIYIIRIEMISVAPYIRG